MARSIEEIKKVVHKRMSRRWMVSSVNDFQVRDRLEKHQFELSTPQGALNLANLLNKYEDDIRSMENAKPRKGMR